MTQNGKGSARRPCRVPRKTYAENWARTFGRGRSPLDEQPKSGPAPDWFRKPYDRSVLAVECWADTDQGAVPTHSR